MDTTEDETHDMDIGRDEYLSEDPEFPPDSKRVKLNVVEHLHEQSDNSQKSEALALLGQEVSANQHGDENVKCNLGVSKINLVTDEPSIDTQSIESDNRNAQIADRNATSCSQTTLPLTPSFIYNNSQRESSCFKSDRFGGRISLFKFDKKSCVRYSKENTESQESNTNLELHALTEDEEKVGCLLICFFSNRWFSQQLFLTLNSDGKCKIHID